jgi:carrier protein
MVNIHHDFTNSSHSAPLVKHIKTVDGLSGCYRGLGPKVCGNLISVVATQKMIDYLDLNRAEEEEDTDVEENR